MKPYTGPVQGKRVLMIVDWLPPDFGAVGQYALGFARERAARGEQVTLLGLSSAASESGIATEEAVAVKGDAATPAVAAEDAVGTEETAATTEEAVGSLSIQRLPTKNVDKSRLRKRIAWMLRTNLRLLKAAWPHLRRADEVVFTGSPPFMLFVLWPIFRAVKARFTYRITDFHPECLMASLKRVPLMLKLLHWLTTVLRRDVHHFEVIGEDQRRRLLALGIEADRISLRRDPSPVRIDASTVPLPLPPELQGQVVLLYSGNYGVAHDVDTFVEGYRRHHQQGSGCVALWLNATGVKAAEVEARIRALGLPLHRSQPVALEQLASLLATPHAHLITLRQNFWGYVLPSKVYGCIASAKPVLYIGPEESDVHLLCSGNLPAACYHRAANGDAAAVAAALESIGQLATARP